MADMRHRRKRLLAGLLALALALGCAPWALAADNKGTVMRLTKTEGTVSASKSSGKSVSVIKNMRLYNGYQMETAEKSYAWINLDDSKLAKMDASSKVSIRKSGKQLELLMDSGNVFFNVTEPLEDDESLNIRTSTMVVGIRGTCGWVSVEDEKNVRVSVLEGTVTVHVSDPVTGQMKSGEVSGGETASCVVYEQDKAGDKCDILQEGFGREDVKGFVLKDLAPDDPLLEEIYQDSGIDLRDLTMEEAEERQREDEEALRRAAEEVESALEKQKGAVSKDSALTDVKDSGEKPGGSSSSSDSSDSSGDSGGSGSSGGSTDPAPGDGSRLPASATAAEINAALAQYDHVTVGDGSTAMTLDGGTVSVPAGKTLDLNGPETIAAGAGLSVDGTANASQGLINNGTLTVSGSNTLNVQEFLENNASFTVTATGRVVVSGNLSGPVSLSRGAAVLFQSHTGLTLPAGWSVSAQASGGYYTAEYQETPTPPTPSSYTVTFDLNGGKWKADAVNQETTTKTRTVDAGETLGYEDMGFDPGDPNCVLSHFGGETEWPSGATGIAGWYANKEGTGTAFDLASPITGNVTLYAKWAMKQVTVTFDLNGGYFMATGSEMKTAAETVVTAGERLGLADGNAGTVISTFFPQGITTPSYSNGSVNSWNTNVDGTGTDFDLTAPITEDMTLYAQWAPKEEVTVTLAKGTPPDGNNIVTSANVLFETTNSFADWNGTAITLTKGGILGEQLPSNLWLAALDESGNYQPAQYVLDGWNTAENGTGDAYSAGSTVTGDITLYPQWASAFKVSLSLNTPSGYLSGIQKDDGTYGELDENAYLIVKKNSPLGELPELVLLKQGALSTDKTFGGWFTEASGGTQYTSDTTITGDVFINAHWV